MFNPVLGREDKLIDTAEQRVKRLRARVRAAAGYHRRAVGSVRPLMITLTYRPSERWQKNHISRFITTLRNWHKRKGRVFRYCWVAELQKRGALHYHILVWTPFSIPFPDKRGWWRYGSTNVIRCKFGGVGYVTKYVSKVESKLGKFPKNVRIYGSGGFTAVERLEQAWYFTPEYVKQKWKHYSFKPRRAVGGGWVSHLTGEWLASQFKLVYVSGSFVFLQRC